MEFDLVFEGGGAKGMVFVGAMKEFFRRRHTYKRILGTSAGAITATLVAAGYTTREMLAALAETKNGKSVFNEFLGDPPPFEMKVMKNGAMSAFLNAFNIPGVPDALEKAVKNGLLLYFAQELPARHVASFIEHGGWYSADNFLTWIKRKLNEGTFNGRKRDFSEMTFSQFFEVTGVDLSLCATDTTARSLLVLNHRTAPNCPVACAARMSMSIPLLWQEVIWDKNWGKYLNQNLTGHTIVDGGALSNFPIELFISDLPTVTALMGPKTSERVLGMLIDEDLPVPGVDQLPQKSAPKTGLKVGDLRSVKRVENLMSTMLEARDRSVITTYRDLVVHLPARDYGTIEFDMSKEKRDLLVAAGEQAMAVYFDSHPRLGTTQTFMASAPARAQEDIDAIATSILPVRKSAPKRAIRVGGPSEEREDR